jgi:hypothetical protein
MAQKGAKPAQHLSDEPEQDEEEEGGLSAYLQPGEQVLIGSLNISVKKFFFHAYLTNQRVFLIDTQEKKLKVTAKDVPLDTIVGSIIEFSENSDPVLVLSIRSPDEEVKTMKLVFAQEGMDRSDEIDEWITLLSGQKAPKKAQKKHVGKPEETPKEEPPEVIEFAKPEKPVQRQELHPAKKPLKLHEKQPPVKRLLSMYKVEEPEPVEEKEQAPAEPVRHRQIRQVQEPARKPIVAKSPDREIEIPPAKESGTQPVKKPEVQAAMKVAMKSAMQPPRQPLPVQPVKRPVPEPVRRPPLEPAAEHEEREEAKRRPTVQEKVQEKPFVEEGAEVPQFCYNCGKKLPSSANFCPGCGTKLSPHRTIPRMPPAQKPSPPPAEKKAPHEEKKVQKPAAAEDEEEREDEVPQPVKPPVKKAPKGSEMTILHKFLRR